MPTAAKDKNAPALSSRFRKAYEATAAERAALLEAELVTINIDVAKCVTTVLGALPEIAALRGAIKKLPQYDLRLFEALERYALATGYAHAMHLAAATPKDFPDGLLQKAEEERNTLLADFEALGRRKSSWAAAAALVANCRQNGLPAFRPRPGSNGCGRPYYGDWFERTSAATLSRGSRGAATRLYAVTWRVR